VVTNEAKLLHWWQIKETPKFGSLASSIKTNNYLESQNTPHQ
jgi:hypothetical protein